VSYLVLGYILIVLIYLTYSAAGIYHLWNYGYVGDWTRKIIIIYSILSVAVIVTSLMLMLPLALMS